MMRIVKWDNNHVVRLARALVQSLGLKIGDENQLKGEGPEEAVARDLRRQRAVERMRRRAWALPDGYAFDRNAAHER